jgi:putative colanic acid biosynthesis glycosyltransferase
VPKFSIITVCHNDFSGLAKTITSVKNQTLNDFEHIVIDAASNDGTVELLKNYSQTYDLLFISEKDDGIYDGMNKGLRVAKGNWAIFLNSGDVFNNDEILSEISLKAESKKSVYFGRALIKLTTKSTWHYPPKFIKSENCKHWIGNNLPNHQAMFFPKNFYTENNYRLDLKISSDSDYKIRALKSCNWVFVDLTICDFAMNGLSSQRTLNNQLQQLIDRFKRSPKNKRYIDLCISFFRATIRWTAYKILGQKSYILIHYLKIVQDYLFVKIKEILH